MMNVQQCIETYKKKYPDKLTKLWLCPNLVKYPKVGQTYVIETNINTQLSESLLNADVTKHWREPGDTLCITYKYDQVVNENEGA